MKKTEKIEKTEEETESNLEEIKSEIWEKPELKVLETQETKGGSDAAFEDDSGIAS